MNPPSRGQNDNQFDSLENLASEHSSNKFNWPRMSFINYI